MIGITPSTFTYILEEHAPLWIIRLQGKWLTAPEGKPLLDALKSIEPPAGWLYLDASQLKFLSSEGLGIWLKLLTYSRTLGGEVFVSGMNKELKDLFLFSKIAHIFTLVDSEEDALNHIKQIQGHEPPTR
jgi:anti-sigma B factor antagonist